MQFIDETYFQGEINIPSVQQTHVLNNLNLFITKYETEYLQAALGYSFWKLFIEGLEAEGQRWINLRDGSEYSNARNHVRKWAGFVNDSRISPIADYVYYWWSRDSITFTTTEGEVKSKKENAVDTSATGKQSRAYNSMVDATKVLWDYLSNAKDEGGTKIYPEFKLEEVDCDMFKYTNIFNL